MDSICVCPLCDKAAYHNVFRIKSLSFKVPVIPIDTNCNLIWWIKLGSHSSPIGGIELLKNVCYNQSFIKFCLCQNNSKPKSQIQVINLWWATQKIVIYIQQQMLVLTVVSITMNLIVQAFFWFIVLLTCSRRPATTQNDSNAIFNLATQYKWSTAWVTLISKSNTAKYTTNLSPNKKEYVYIALKVKWFN